jgi:hypothetical protein
MVLENKGYGAHLTVQPARLVHDLRCQFAGRCQHQAAREGGGEGRGWGRGWFISRPLEGQRDGPPLLPNEIKVLFFKNLFCSLTMK